MMDKLTRWEATLSAFFAALATLLGWRGVMFVLFISLMVFDFVSGWVAACKNGEWKSSIARNGVAHKFGMLLVVVAAGMMDLCLVAICKTIPDTPFTWPSAVLPFVLAWYMITEVLSIVENAIRLGAPVPKWLKRMLEAGRDAIDSAADNAQNMVDKQRHL